MGLIWQIIKAVVNNTSGSEMSKKDNLERKMNSYGLEPWQKDLVRKGDYDPWNFEETGDLEEDDYYYEDDDK